MGIPVPQEDLPNNYSFSPLDMAIQQEGISGDKEKFVRAIYGQESGAGTNTGTSNRGAVGGMQIRPATFNSVAEDNWDIHNPVHNARAGIRYALEGLDQANGDYRKAAVYYYGGPSALKDFNQGIYRSDVKNPEAPDTNEYSDQVVSRMGKISITHRSKLVPVQDIPKEFLLNPHEGSSHGKKTELDNPLIFAQADIMSNQERNEYFNATGEKISGSSSTPQNPVPSTDIPNGYISTTPPSNLSGLIKAKIKGGMTEEQAKQWATENGIK